MKTDVVIIGGGPSGLLLSQILHRAGIETVVLERQTVTHVKSRIRAGVLEWGTVEMLRKAGVGARMDTEGFPHSGVYVAAQNRGFRIPFDDHTGKKVMVYGQTEVTADLYDARFEMNGVVIDEAEDVAPNDLHGDKPYVTYAKNGTEHRIDCRFVAGCDGFHGVSRKSIPKGVLTEYQRVYPFGWLGVLAEAPPVSHELIYANHPRGFALCSMRNENLSRYYVQVPSDDKVAAWSDEAFWTELRKRLPNDAAENIVTASSIEKSIAPLRSFVAEPMSWGSLFLVGDAAHIVPPTGAKGLNLAVSDVHYLSEALIAWFNGDRNDIHRYSDRALARVWSAIRFSWWFTTTMHRFPDQTNFDQKIQEVELALLETNMTAQRAMAEQYVGLPY